MGRRVLNLLISIIFLIVTISLAIPVKTEAFEYGSDGKELWGEDTRSILMENLKKEYPGLENKSKKYSDEDMIIYEIKKLAIEYCILVDYIAVTDHFIYINFDADTISATFQPGYEYVMYGYGKEEMDLEDYISLMNYNIDIYNTTEAESFNLWWYSLGDNAEKYSYVMDNIYNKINVINGMIHEYNSYHKEPVNYIDLMDKVYPNSKKYKKADLKKIYDKIIWNYHWYDQIEYIYPQDRLPDDNINYADKYKLPNFRQETLFKTSTEANIRYIQHYYPEFEYSDDMYLY